MRTVHCDVRHNEPCRDQDCGIIQFRTSTNFNQIYSRDFFADPRQEHEFDGIVRVTLDDHFKHAVLDVVGGQMRLEFVKTACACSLQEEVVFLVFSVAQQYPNYRLQVSR